VEITPQPGNLTELHTGMVHPFGNIQVDYRLVEGQWQGAATLPENLSGTVILPGNRRLELHGGVNRFQWEEKGTDPALFNDRGAIFDQPCVEHNGYATTNFSEVHP